MLTPIVRDVAAGRRAADLAAVVHAAGGRLHDLHAVSVGRIRVRRRRGRRAARGGAATSARSGGCTSSLGASGAALIALGFYTAGRPSIYRVSSFWTSSPTWFAIRVGILMMALTRDLCAERSPWTAKPNATLSRASVDASPLARLGRSSLFIYWIHVELVYGYASWLWRHRLPLWGTAIAFVAVLRR